MSIFEAFEIAFADRDIDALGALFHSDYEMTMPSSGRTLTKKDWITGFGKILASGTVAHEKVCCLYENDHVLVTRFLASSQMARLILLCGWALKKTV